MSVQLLSSAIKDGLAPDPDRVPDSSDERPGTFKSEAFDKVFDAAFEKAESKAEQTKSAFTDAEVGAQISEPKGLDARLSASMERAEAKDAEAASFKASRESRDELNERYAKHGDLPKTLSMVLEWVDDLKKSPARTAAMMAESYARATPWALTDKVETKPAEDDPYGRKKLDAVLSEAIDRASSEKKEFEGTKEQRAKLKQVFPNLSFDEALKRIVQIDRDMHKDPINTAAQVAAMFGMPVTPVAIAAKQHTDEQIGKIGAAIDSLIPSLPNFNADAVMTVLKLPDFKRSADPVADMQRAYQVTQAIGRHVEGLNQHTQAQLAAMPENLRNETLQVIASPQFKKIVDAAPLDGGYRNFDIAVGMAQQRLQSGVARAKRAAPVRGTSSVVATGGKPRDPLDAAISRALAGHR